jgi:hypothetical protein
MIPWLGETHEFPPLVTALTEPNGLLAAGGDLDPQRILAAYQRGIFPWYSSGEPVLWWSPDPRMVLVPGELKISRSLAKTLRKANYEVRLDSAFDEVIHACAVTPRASQPGTWITAEMQQAYRALHRLGYAHSVETWIGDKLAGGLYGIALGQAFFRRIDVQPCTRCVENCPGAFVRPPQAPQIRHNRLPDGNRSPRLTRRQTDSPPRFCRAAGTTLPARRPAGTVAGRRD